MNRRQVLFGAGATAIAFSSFVPWSNPAYAADVSVTARVFTPFELGIRGDYMLRGTVVLLGQIPMIDPPVVSKRASDGGVTVKNVPAPAASVSTPALPDPAVSTSAQYSAPPVKPVMSIVRVSR